MRPQTRAALLAAFEKAARSETDRLSAAGFRAGDGTGTLDVPGLAAEGPAAAATDLDSAAQLEILRAWAVLTLRSRMLAVIDVSGSMEEPAENGLRRIDIFQQAAIGAMEKFSGEVEMGVWVFSTARNGDIDYEDLSPIAPLADLAHKQEIAGIIQSLPGRLGGATGLYDTTLAAVQRVRESYDPEKVNSVLLITDGRNEDENGIDLDTLLAELAKMDDPSKPVPVIMIGFGPDTDLAAMQQIAQATKGAAYSASKPEDLGTVLGRRALAARAVARTADDPRRPDRVRPSMTKGPASCRALRHAAVVARGVRPRLRIRPRRRGRSTSCRPAGARRTHPRRPRSCRSWPSWGRSSCAGRPT